MRKKKLRCKCCARKLRAELERQKARSDALEELLAEERDRRKAVERVLSAWNEFERTLAE